MAYANGQLPSWRPLAPLALIGGLLGGGLLALLGVWWPLVGLLALWALVLLGVGLGAGGSFANRARTAVATAIMQLSYGAGLLGGLLRGPGSRRHLRG